MGDLLLIFYKKKTNKNKHQKINLRGENAKPTP
jgi:hypothetical protein